MGSASAMWEDLVEKAFLRWDKTNYVRNVPKISLPNPNPSPAENPLGEVETFDGPGPWDRTLIELEVEQPERNKKMVLFSGNDYLGLSSHPAVRKAAAKAALVHGMGPKGSAMVCGQTDYHRLLESSLADLTKKEACVVCPTGFAANTAFLSALGSISSLLAAGRRPTKAEKIAIFSDSLNHASIIDGLHMVERHREADVTVYRHNDMSHLDSLLANCTQEKKVVFTDSLFSMEGDFAPILELVELRRKHGFLLVIDDAHTTLVCGKNGGGIADVYGIEDQIDICVGTLSKAVGCQGGFITCSEKWKLLIQSRGRPYIFTTALSLPVVAAAYASVRVAKKESWRRREIWSRVEEFSALTKYPATSPIVSLVVGSEESALRASSHMLNCGFHVIAIRPPAVAANACRLRVTLTAAHTKYDIIKLVAALSQCVKFPALEGQNDEQIASRL